MKIPVKIIAILMLFAAFTVIACGGSDTTPATTYAIGDTGPGGGIVFYVTNGGLRGLEAAPSLWNGGSEDPTSAWSTITDAYANGSSPLPTGIGAGAANTTAIIAQNSNAASAAKLCRDYHGGGFIDWFLPSKDELAQMYAQKAVIGGFADDNYWSSSESTGFNGRNALVQDFHGGSQGDNSKFNAQYVRPVRAF